jgi:nitrogen fixation protein FixH
MDPSILTVRVLNAHDNPVTDAVVHADLAMPGMDMGTNSVSLTQKARGTYCGTVRFPMGGDWRMTVTATKGQDKSTQTYPVTVR